MLEYKAVLIERIRRSIPYKDILSFKGDKKSLYLFSKEELYNFYKEYINKQNKGEIVIHVDTSV